MSGQHDRPLPSVVERIAKRSVVQCLVSACLSSKWATLYTRVTLLMRPCGARGAGSVGIVSSALQRGTAAQSVRLSNAVGIQAGLIQGPGEWAGLSHSYLTRSRGHDTSGSAVVCGGRPFIGVMVLFRLHPPSEYVLPRAPTGLDHPGDTEPQPTDLPGAER